MKTMHTQSVSLRMRVVLLTLSASAMLGVPLTARGQIPDPAPSTQQSPPRGGAYRGGHMEERQIEMLTKHLDLTPDQVTQLKAIDDQSRQQMKALWEDTTTPREQKRPKMEAIHKDQQAKVMAMLTGEQKTKYEAMQARMLERRQDHRGGNATEAPPAPPSAS